MSNPTSVELLLSWCWVGVWTINLSVASIEFNRSSFIKSLFLEVETDMLLVKYFDLIFILNPCFEHVGNGIKNRKHISQIFNSTKPLQKQNLFILLVNDVKTKISNIAQGYIDTVANATWSTSTFPKDHTILVFIFTMNDKNIPAILPFLYLFLRISYTKNT